MVVWCISRRVERVGIANKAESENSTRKTRTDSQIDLKFAVYKGNLENDI